IVVEAQTLRADRSLAGFYERKKSGFGRYYTLADLKRRPLETLQALLLESGVQVRCRVGQCVPLVSDGGRLCVMSLFLDGLRMPSDYLNRSEEHTSELQSRFELVCRLLLEKKKKIDNFYIHRIIPPIIFAKHLSNYDY